MLWKGLTLNPTNIKLYFIKPGLINILQRSLQLDQQKNLAFSQKPDPLQRTYVFLLLFFLVESLLKRVRQSLDRFSCKTKTKIIYFIKIKTKIIFLQKKLGLADLIDLIREQKIEKKKCQIVFKDLKVKTLNR